MLCYDGPISSRLSAALVAQEKHTLKLNQFYEWFTTAVCRWLDIALFKAMIRIGKAIALDSLHTVDSLIKFSSSAVDTVTVFYQVTTTPVINTLGFAVLENYITLIMLHLDQNVLGTAGLA